MMNSFKFAAIAAALSVFCTGQAVTLYTTSFEGPTSPWLGMYPSWWADDTTWGVSKLAPTDGAYSAVSAIYRLPSGQTHVAGVSAPYNPAVNGQLVTVSSDVTFCDMPNPYHWNGTGTAWAGVSLGIGYNPEAEIRTSVTTEAGGSAGYQFFARTDAGLTLVGSAPGGGFGTQRLGLRANYANHMVDFMIGDTTVYSAQFQGDPIADLGIYANHTYPDLFHPMSVWACFDKAEIDADPVPEPSLLIGFAVVGLAALRRRR